MSAKYLVASTTFAKLIASSVSYPHEVVRARMQYEKPNANCLKDNLLCVTKRIVKNEGLRGLYSGFTLNIAKAIPASILYFLIYENICIYTGVNNSGN